MDFFCGVVLAHCCYHNAYLSDCGAQFPLYGMLTPTLTFSLLVPSVLPLVKRLSVCNPIYTFMGASSINYNEITSE